MAAWLAVIARHRAIDALRRRRPENDIEDVVVSVEPDLASEADRSRAMEKVRDALETMAAPQRSALEMAYFEGLTHSEIADKTGEPLGTIKTRIRTGCCRCEKCWPHERARTIRGRPRRCTPLGSLEGDGAHRSRKAPRGVRLLPPRTGSHARRSRPCSR